MNLLHIRVILLGQIIHIILSISNVITENMENLNNEKKMYILLCYLAISQFYCD